MAKERRPEGEWEAIDGRTAANCGQAKRAGSTSWYSRTSVSLTLHCITIYFYDIGFEKWPLWKEKVLLAFLLLLDLCWFWSRADLCPQYNLLTWFDWCDNRPPRVKWPGFSSNWLSYLSRSLALKCNTHSLPLHLPCVAYPLSLYLYLYHFYFFLLSLSLSLAHHLSPCPSSLPRSILSSVRAGATAT